MSTLDRTYELNNPPVIADVVDGEAIAIDLESGVYYSLVGPAGAVWEALCAGAPPRTIVDPDAAGDTDRLARFVEALVEEGLLRRSATPADLTATAPVWHGAELGFERFTDMEDLLGLDPIHGVDERVGWPEAPGP